MSISPVSDIVLGVAQAADPAAGAAAAERLRRMGVGAPAQAGFASALAGSGPPVRALAAQTMARGAPPPVDPAVKARKGLEAFFLQGVIEAILPKSEGVFGMGTSGEVWRSMLAEQIARELGKSIDLGIADPAKGKAHAPRAVNAVQPHAATEVSHG